MTAPEQHRELVHSAIDARACDVWSAVDAVLAVHTPRQVRVIDCTKCDVHSFKANPSATLRRSVDLDACPGCVKTMEWSCGARDCHDWPCVTTKAIAGALGVLLP
ncbi:MAG: hypothetical protein JWO67_4485 [Streptosporangiaceae bacterium]|nr:hypothetical protein [Streptosporangiaceae bacterium]